MADTRIASGAEQGLADYRLDTLVPEQPHGAARYQGIQISAGRPTLITVWPSKGDDHAERFFKDAERLRAISGRGVANAVYGYGHDTEGLWLAVAAFEGRSLAELLGLGSLPPLRAFRILGEAADAVDAAHRQGVLHRDLSPHAIVVSTQGTLEQVVVQDFAIGRAPDQADLSADAIGYRSLEELQGESATTASDVYSLGVLVFQSLTGSLPFPERDAESLKAALLSTGPPSLTGLDPKLSPELDKLMTRALSAKPLQRPETAAELMGEASRALVAETSLAPPTAAASAPLPPAPAPAPAPEAKPEPAPEPEPQPAPEAPQEPEPHVAPPMPAADRPSAPSPITDHRPPTTDEPIFASTKTRSGGRLPLVAAIALVLLAAGGGLALGSTLQDDEAPAAEQVRSANVGWTVPSGWTRANGGGSASELRDPVSFTSASSGRLTAGTAGDASESDRLAASVIDNPSKPEAVRLGDAEALRYRGTSQGAPAALYVAPTTSGSLAHLCSGGSLADCEKAASQLRPAGPTPKPLEAAPAPDGRAEAALTRLNRSRSTLLRRLARARTPRGQASTLRSLSAAHRTAARQVGDPSLAGPLRRVSRAYLDMGRAARREASGNYAKGRGRVRRGERALRRAIAGR